MKLEKSNKYNKYRVIGMSMLLSGAILLSGCSFKAKAEEVIEPTSTPIVTIVPTNTPKPTPAITNTPRPTNTPKPTAMPMIELTGEDLENAIKELCVLNPKAKNVLGLYRLCIFETADGNKKVMITYCAIFGDPTDMHVYDIFTDEELFTFYDSTKLALMEKPEKENIKIINPLFEDANIVTLDVVPMVGNYADYLNIDFDQELRSKYYPNSCSLTELSYTVRHMAEMYVNLIPEPLRIKASDLNPIYEIEETPKVK